MYRETSKVFLACAIGAGIGSLVSLQFSEIFCWVGFLLGGLAGYLSYEWKNVIKAIPRAYRATVNYRFTRGYFSLIKWMVLWWLDAMLWGSVILTFVSYYCANSEATENMPFVQDLIAGIAASLLLSLMIVAFGLGYVSNSEQENSRKRQEWKDASILLFPPVFIFCAIVGISKFAITILTRSLPQMLKTLFLLIHSEMRLLCGTDAMIGAVIGYFAGSAIIGALAGGIFGVFNYLIITELCLKRLGYIPVQK